MLYCCLQVVDWWSGGNIPVDMLGKKLWMYNKMVGETQKMLCAEAAPEAIASMLEKMVADLTKQIYRKKRRR